MILYSWGFWQVVLEILFLWIIYYSLFVFLKGTRALAVMKGLFLLIAIFFISEIADLVVMNWILKKLLAIWLIALIIIFQPELRRGLATIGQFGLYPRKEQVIDEISKAVESMSKRKVGALIAIERDVGLKHYIETGVKLDSHVSSELLCTIFMPNTALHDGGVIIKEGRIVAATCLFPLSQDLSLSKELGTRHRAALGLSEETDAVVIVVSEETGGISLAISGRLNRDLDRESLSRILSTVYRSRKKT